MMIKIRLGDPNYCRVFSAGDKPKNFTLKKTSQNTIPVIANGVENDGIIGYTDLAKFEGNAVTVSARGSVGFSFFRDYPYYPVIRLITILTNEQKIDAKYLYFMLKNSPLTGIGSVQDQLTVPDLSMMEIYIEDDLNKQKQIAYELSKIEDQIIYNNKVVTDLLNLSETIYKYWFFQYDFPNQCGKPYKTNGGKLVFNEVLKREIPVGWKVANIKDFCNINWGQCPSGEFILHKDTDVVGAIDYCSGAGDMRNGLLVDCQSKTNCSRKSAKAKDILMSVAGSIGLIAIVDHDISIGRAAVSFTSKRGSNLFIYLTLKTYADKMKEVATGSIQKVISEDNINEINFAYCDEILQKFEEYSSLLDMGVSLSLENKELKSYFNFILPLLLNGQTLIKEGR